MDIRTLLFANAFVFVALALAMLLVWRANLSFPGLSSLARVHFAMLGGSVLIGIPPTVMPAPASMISGNLLVLLSGVWLLNGIRGLYGRQPDRSFLVVLPAWLAAILFFLLVEPDLRARILATSIVAMSYLFRASWTACLGLRRREEQRASLLIGGSLGLLGLMFAGRVVFLASGAGVTDPVANDPLSMALVGTSLVAGTGWTMGVMSLIYVRLNEETRRSREAMEQLVQVAAHELRTPLTSIVGTLGLLAADGSVPLSSAERQRLMDVARRNSQRMSLLVNHLLDLERVESGRAAFEIASVDLGLLLLQALELSEGQARRLGVQVVLAPLPPTLPQRIQTDSQRLLQVLINLLSNAIKFSPSGETVRLSARPGPDRIRVEVEDRGPGIPRDLRPRIFQRFVRGNAADANETQGTGLGLAISKALIEGMGGKIGFETSDSRGTTFFFELPAAGP